MNHLTLLRSAPLAALLLGASAVLPSAAAQLPVVTLYENSFFGGQSLPILLSPPLQNVPFGLGSLSDETTSISWADLPPMVRVLFWEDQDGGSVLFEIQADDPRTGFSTNVGPVANDRISAVSWELVDPSAAGTINLFNDPGLAGEQRLLPLSSYGEGEVHELFGLNDQVESLMWSLMPNEVVTFFENADGTGREYTVTHDQDRNGSVTILPDEYRDRFSSFRWDVIDPSQGFVRMFTDSQLDGFQLTRYVSETGFGVFGLPGYEDQIDSVSWDLPDDTTIWLRDGGACLALTGEDARSLSNSAIWSDSINTFEVQPGDLCADGSDRNRAYDQNTYLSANNAHASDAAGWNVQFYQDLSVFSQLEYGVRTLKIQTLLHIDGQIYLVNESFARSATQRGSLPTLLDPLLIQVRTWLDANPREVVTLIFDHQGGDELGVELTQFSTIRDFIHLQQRATWPTLNELIDSGKRLVVFENESAPSSPALNQQHEFMVVNSELAFGQTSRRPGSEPIDEARRSLFYLNNISPLVPSLWAPGVAFNVLSTLNALAGSFVQIPNYIAVDRITEAGEGAADAVRSVNLAQWPFLDQAGIRASFASFGPLTCGQRRLAATNRPVAGMTLNLELVAEGAPALGAGAFLFGFSDLLISGAPVLPLEAGTAGVSCLLRTSGEVSVPFPGGLSSPMSFQIPLPSAPGLIGLALFIQTAELSGGELALSTLGRARIGQL